MMWLATRKAKRETETATKPPICEKRSAIEQLVAADAKASGSTKWDEGEM
jgi:hypothetical protein